MQLVSNMKLTTTARMRGEHMGQFMRSAPPAPETLA
jgi:hypothetical protein